MSISVCLSLQAGQAKETETLIPLLYQCPNLILVGDPHQLPPTVVSQVLQTVETAKKTGLKATFKKKKKNFPNLVIY